MSQSIKSEWKSKIPRPVSNIPRPVKLASKPEPPKPNVFKVPQQRRIERVEKKPKEPESKVHVKQESLDLVPTRSIKKVGFLDCDVIPDVDFSSIKQEEIEFQEDKNSLDSILSNKGITASTLSSKQSSALQPGAVKRSSIYYQSPGRMSMIDSHNLWKEKMKILKDQMKSLNITEGPLKTDKTKTPTSGSSTKSPGRTLSIYYKMKPLHIPTKPADAKSTVLGTDNCNSNNIVKNLSLSERKDPSRREVNYDRLCQTASKLDSNSSDKASVSIKPGKENRCRYKLFSSPIVEIPENVSPQSLANSNSTSQNSSCQSISRNKDHEIILRESSNNQSSVVNDNCTSSSSSSLPYSDRIPATTSLCVSSCFSTVSSLSSQPRVQSVRECPVLSTPTACTWSIKNSVCTPQSQISSSRLLLIPQSGDSRTPTGQNNQDPDNCYSSVNVKSQVSTPSRIVRKNATLQAPQRTPKALESSQAPNRSKMITSNMSSKQHTHWH